LKDIEGVVDVVAIWAANTSDFSREDDGGVLASVKQDVSVLDVSIVSVDVVLDSPVQRDHKHITCWRATGSVSCAVARSELLPVSVGGGGGEGDVW
jgi:hypothetical protein